MTLYFALLKGFNLQVEADSTPSRGFLLLIIIMAAISISAAAFSAFPANYPALRDPDFQQYLTEIYNGTASDHPQVMLELKISQLATATKSNQRKAMAIFVSFTSFGLLAVLLVAALAESLVSG
ncbi:hypothetical protein C6A85_96770 [Mycobacterium sp. ITM-2017-0098]|nr:hypothetical protein C6A85_96770 [Mycobacterium sp. ITM-2017-0098]